MKAYVQYNDVIGTVAADVADWYSNSLQAFLEKAFKFYDGNRFSCRGCTAYIGERNSVSVYFICLDKESGDFVKLSPQKYWTTEEFFNLFKRFEIVIGKDMEEIGSAENMQEITLDNEEQEG